MIALRLYDTGSCMKALMFPGRLSFSPDALCAIARNAPDDGRCAGDIALRFAFYLNIFLPSAAFAFIDGALSLCVG